MQVGRVSVMLFLLIFGMLLILILIQAPGQISEQFGEAQYLTTVHVTSRTGPLVIWFPPMSVPCERSVSALSSVLAPSTPRLEVGAYGPFVGDHEGLSCTDLVSMLFENVGSGHANIVAACPGGDLVLTVNGCLGSSLPPVPAAKGGPTFYDVEAAGGTIFCAGQVEFTMVTDLVACALPPLTVLIALMPVSQDAGTGVIAFLRPPGHAEVVTALARPRGTSVLVPTVDVGRFALLQPLARLRGNGGGGTLITSTAVLVGSLSLDGDPRVDSVARTLTDMDPFWAVTELNMASRYLPLLPSTRELLRPIDHAARVRDGAGINPSVTDIGIPSRPVLARDGFLNDFPAITLMSDTPVKGYLTSTAHNGWARTLVCSSAYIGAARMRIGDRVFLSNQTNVQHDGRYVVSALGQAGTVLVSWFEATYDARSFVDVLRNGLLERGDGDSGLMSISVSALLDPALGQLWPSTPLQVDDRLLLRNLDEGRGVWTRVRQVEGSVVTLAAAQMLLQTAASGGSCVTSPATLIQSECTGDGGVWDAPCESDDQCPYYQKNTRYPNYRGGCSESGWCEMPLGVQQLSYRVAHGEPVCHDGHRCHPGDPDPDLAFALDEYERSAFVVRGP